jgi:LmbE family N-acetylglucosaminyl deacetylase
MRFAPASVLGGSRGASLLTRRLVHFVGRRIADRENRDLPRPDSGRAQTVGALLSAARRAAPASLGALTRGGPIIIIAPHPDDETIGCGGLLAACADAGVPAYVFVLTDGGFSHPKSAGASRQLSRRRTQETVRALRRLGHGGGTLTQLNLTDGRSLFDRAGMQRAAQRIAKFAVSIDAKTVFTTWAHDPHPDHMAAALVAERVRARAPRVRLLHYPIRGRFLASDIALTGAPWKARRFDAGRWLGAKRAAMAAYRSQTTPSMAAAGIEFRFNKGEVAPYLSRYEFYFERG